MTAPRILDDLQARRLEAQRRLASSCAPEDSRPPRQPARRSWPVQQPQSAIDAACFAGFQRFTRERDPERAARRYDSVPERTKQARRDEFLAGLDAFVAAGGRI